MRQTTSRSASRRIAQGPRPVAADRRTHVRLRDLCDEVLASYRVARGDELLSAQDRAAADSLLAQVAPPTRG